MAAEAGGFGNRSAYSCRINISSLVAMAVGADHDATGRGQPLVGATGGSPGRGIVALAAREGGIGSLHIIAETLLQLNGSRVVQIVGIPGQLALTGAVLAGGKIRSDGLVAGGTRGIFSRGSNS